MIDYNALNNYLSNDNNNQTQEQKDAQNSGFFKSTGNKIYYDTGMTKNAMLSKIYDSIGNSNLFSNNVNNAIKDVSQDYKDKAVEDYQKSQMYNKDYQNNPLSLKGGAYNLIHGGADLGMAVAPSMLVGAIAGASRGGIPGAIAGGLEGASEGITLRQTLNQMIKNQAEKVALGTTMGIQNMGNVNAQNIIQNGKDIDNTQALESFGSGAVLGSLQANQLLGKFGNPESLIGKVGLNAGVGAGTGVAQSMANRGTLNQELFNQEAINEYKNNAIVGGLMGSVAGGIHGAINSFGKKPVQEEIKPVEQSQKEIQKQPQKQITQPQEINTLNDLSNSLTDTLNNYKEPVNQNNKLSDITNELNENLKNYKKPELTSDNLFNQPQLLKLNDDDFIQVLGDDKNLNNKFNTLKDNLSDNNNITQDKLNLLNSVKEIINQSDNLTTNDKSDFLNNLIEKSKNNTLSDDQAKLLSDNLNGKLSNKIDFNSVKDDFNDIFNGSVKEIPEKTFNNIKDNLIDKDNKISQDKLELLNTIKDTIKNSYDDTSVNETNGTRNKFLNDIKKQISDKNFNDLKAKLLNEKLNDFNLKTSQKIGEDFANKKIKENIDNENKIKNDILNKQKSNETSIEEQQLNKLNLDDLSDEDIKNIQQLGDYISNKKLNENNNYNEDKINSQKLKEKQIEKQQLKELEKDSQLKNLQSKETSVNFDDNYNNKNSSFKKQLDLENKKELLINEQKKFNNESAQSLQKIGEELANKKLNEKNNLNEDKIESQKLKEKQILREKQIEEQQLKLLDLENEKELSKQIDKENPFYSVLDNSPDKNSLLYKNKLKNDYENEKMKLTNGPKLGFMGVKFSGTGKDIGVTEVNYGYIKRMSEINPLNIKEKAEITQIKNKLKPIQDNINAEIIIIPEKYSPFENKNGWYDSNTNRIVIVGTKESLNNVHGVLEHEVFHRGINALISDKGREVYENDMNKLYLNKTVKEIADRNKQNGMSKALAVEEAIGDIIQNRTLENTPFLQRVFDTVKKLVNMITGKDTLVTNDDVRNYYNKTLKFALKNPEDVIRNNNTIDSVIKFSTAITQENMKEYVRDLNQTKELNVFDKIKLINDKDYKESQSQYNKISPLLRLIGNQDQILSRLGGYGNRILSTIDNQNILKNNLFRLFSNKNQELFDLYKSKEKHITETDKIIKRNAYEENDGHGVRVEGNDLRKQLIDKGITGDKLEKAMYFANKVRESADTHIYLKAFSDSISTIEALKSGLDKINDNFSPLINKMIDTVSRNEFSKDSTEPNIHNFNEKIREVFNDGLKGLTDKQKQSVDNLLKEIDNVYKNANDMYERGYIPKDMTGKYTLVIKATDKDGNQQTIGLIPHNDNRVLSKVYSDMKKQFGDNFHFEYGERTEGNHNYLDLKEAIIRLQKQNFKFTDEQLKALPTLNALNDELSRTFSGVGYNKNVAEVLTKSGINEIKQLSGTFMSNEIGNLVNKFPPHSVERAVAESVLNQRIENAKVSDDAVSKSLSSTRKIVSAFNLTFNFANTIANHLQGIGLSYGYFNKYGQGITNSKVIDAFKVLGENNTFKKTGDKMLDDLLSDIGNHELLTSSMTNQLLEQSSGEVKGLWSKMVDSANKVNHLNERTIRMETVLRAVDAWKDMEKGKFNEQLTTEMKQQGLRDFVLTSLRDVNGDFSRENRSRLLKSDFAQTLLMYQNWKMMTYQALSKMDTAGKLKYAGFLLATAGTMGLPFMKDGTELVDAIAKMFGFNNPAKVQLHNLSNMIAKSLTDDKDSQIAVENLISQGIPGIGKRAGLGEIIPGMQGLVELANGKSDKGISDILGPAVGMVRDITGGGEIIGQLAKGDFQGAGNTINAKLLPTFMKNIVDGARAFNNGYTMNGEGTAKMFDVSGMEAMAMALGFKSSHLQGKEESYRLQQNYESTMNDIKKDYTESLKRALVSGDNDQVNNLVKSLASSGIMVDIPSVIKSSTLNPLQADTKFFINLSTREKAMLMRDLKI